MGVFCIKHYNRTIFLEFVERAKDSLKEFDSSVLISLIRAETNLDESPLFGGLELAKSVVDEVIEEFKGLSSPESGQHEHNSRDILSGRPQQHQEIQNEDNGA